MRYAIVCLMAVCFPLNAASRDVELKVDLDKLGLGPRIAVSRALEHPIKHDTEPASADPMDNTPLQFGDGILPLRLGAHNFELLKIEPE